jgi:GT2 family glycosyltransferase
MDGAPKVLIGLSTTEYIRHASFLPHFLGLTKPDGTLIITVHGQSPATSRNTIAEQAINNDCTHVLFLDDDMIPPPDTLTKLLAHDKDIVSALYLLRTYPHYPAFFDEAFENGFCRYAFLEETRLAKLEKGVNAGLGAVLIKTDVFKNMEKPWVRLGEIIKDGWCDDVGFFNRARAKGYDVYCDLNAPVGHMTNVAMWPELANGKWFTNYKHPTGTILFPQHIPTKEEISADQKKQLELLTPL